VLSSPHLGKVAPCGSWCAVIASLLFVLAPGCGSDPAGGGPDAGDDVDDAADVAEEPDSADLLDGGDAANPDADADADAAPDLAVDVAPDVVADVVADVVPDTEDDVIEPIFPRDPDAPCTDGGNGARGVVRFGDGVPLYRAIVSLSGPGFEHLGITDEEGGFYIRVPCGEVTAEVTFESANYPVHPTLTALPLGEFDASVDEPTFDIPLVAVSGEIIDVRSLPIAGARLQGELVDGDIRVFNEAEADEEGLATVQLVPWSDAPYRLTALGPEDSDKSYRSATLTVLIGDPPPEPSTFVLYEDRCPAPGPVRTSEGTPLDWLYIQVDGEPYPERIIYFSFDRGFYYEQTDPDTVTEGLPLQCGVQSVKLWNAIWVNPDWPCIDHRFPDQLCLSNYPIFDEALVAEPLEGIVIPVVRVGGEVRDEGGELQDEVTVRYEATYQWGDSSSERLTVFNEAVTDDGYYNMVVLAYPDIEYRVTTRIRDDDPRPLGELEAFYFVSEATNIDLTLPEAPPRCILGDTIHSSEGRDFHEIRTDWFGFDSETGEALYPSQPVRFFSPEPGRYHRVGFEDEEIDFVPLLCGDHSLSLHSVDWPGCGSSPDEICFSAFPWWNREPVEEPMLDGLEIPVVHLSGFVRGPDGEAVAGVGVSATYPVGFFNFATNSTGTDARGLYDLVVLPNTPWQVSASIPDDHPQLDDYWPPDVVNFESGEFGGQVNLTLLEGPERCRLSGPVTTSDGVELNRLTFNHYSPWYGLTGWEFRSDLPAEYYRGTDADAVRDVIPLVCGEQSLYITSRLNTSLPSCFNTERWREPCLSNYAYWNGYDLTEPEHGLEIPVVTITGRVTQDGETPIALATVSVDGRIEAGRVFNQTVTRPDGTYSVVVVPSETREYVITITTPLDVDLGQVEFREIVDGDTVVDADFSRDG
jgi:hypothetical protein